MRLFVGLGNPGDQHADDRHNIGFMAVDEIIRHHAFGAERRRFDGLLADGTIDGARVLVLKPTTFMNESGRAVGQAVRYFKIPLDDVVVFHDELDLAPGKLRVKQNGGNAGHNGLRSIDAHIGREYHRVRLGIGHPGNKNRVMRYVLSDFAKADDVWLDPLLDAVAKAAPLLAAGDPPGFATRVALLLRPPENQRREKKAPPGDAPTPVEGAKENKS